MATNVSRPFGSPTYMTLYNYEADFDYHYWQTWMGNNWTLSVYFAVAYVILIYLGRTWMRNRQPYKLQGPLILWNVGLAVFSFVGFMRTLPELVHLMQSKDNGFHLSCCMKDEMHMGTVFWTLMILLSKVVELGDTLFIVLRKQPLIFLHWYHHATVMLYTWYTYWYHDAAHRWFMNINFGIHSVMYSYYALKAMGVKLPRSLSKVITMSQLAQMFFGIGVNVYALYAKQAGKVCQTETFNIQLALGMYATYCALFANFFNKSYRSRSQRKTTKSE